MSLKSIVSIISLSFLSYGCSYAKANTQTLFSSDCGVHWELIPAGRSIPVSTMPCDMKVSVPDYPMPGETKFKTSFKDRVLVNVEVSYEYTISDAKVFISEAKYLGKANSDVDDNSNSAAAYETAENTVIDKRIREAATSTLLNEDIVDFSQAEYEDKLLEKANESLKSKGVKLNFISFVPIPEEQTRLAIDMLTAMKVYKTQNMEELGKQLAVSRAGAAKINLSTTPPAKKETADQ